LRRWTLLRSALLVRRRRRRGDRRIPAVLLKLYIYGYLNRVQSSRRLEREAGRNVELMWLLGRLIPDHKTIANSARTMAVLCARCAFAS
jgi:transposase